jgi:opacity protein-like surface antigen
MFVNKTLLWGALSLVCLASAASAADPAGKPARPTDLRAKATSTSEVKLTWSDNATDEWEYHLDIRTAGTEWSELGLMPRNVTFVQVFNLAAGKTYFFRLRAKNGGGWSSYSNEGVATAFHATPPTCVAGANVMCLGGGRYRVQASFERGTEIRGLANAIDLSDESGLFWFFSPGNVEAIVKVLDGCSVNGHRWVYTTGLTDLRVLVQIVDTQTGETATYLNEGGSAFAPAQDTEALRCS